MKQLLLVALIVVSLGAVLVLPASSQESDSIEVRVSPLVVLGVNIEQTLVDHGPRALSTGQAMQDRSVVTSGVLNVTNMGNAEADLYIRGSNATPTNGGLPWTLSCEPDALGTVGLDTYVHRFYIAGNGAGALALCPETDKLLQADVASSALVEFHLQLHMPTGTTGFGQRTNTVTITAVQSQ